MEPLAYLQECVRRTPALAGCYDAMTEAFFLMETCWRGGGKLLLCGNGGSAADCLHITGELMKGFILPRRIEEQTADRLRAACPDGALLAQSLQEALPAISLVSETSLVTAYANDVRPELAFAQQVWGYGRPGDVLMGISTSGNSDNVVYAMETARFRGLATIALTGAGGGRLRAFSDVCIAVPEREPHRVQELHLPVYHALCLALEAAFFGA